MIAPRGYSSPKMANNKGNNANGNRNDFSKCFPEFAAKREWPFAGRDPNSARK